jgi:hypothetical protein
MVLSPRGVLQQSVQYGIFCLNPLHAIVQRFALYGRRPNSLLPAAPQLVYVALIFDALFDPVQGCPAGWMDGSKPINFQSAIFEFSLQQNQGSDSDP